jgi:hypothetical protein
MIFVPSQICVFAIKIGASLFTIYVERKTLPPHRLIAGFYPKRNGAESAQVTPQIAPYDTRCRHHPRCRQD